MYFDDDDGILKLGDMAKKLSSSSGNTYFHMFLHYTYHCCCGFFSVVQHVFLAKWWMGKVPGGGVENLKEEFH